MLCLCWPRSVLHLSVQCLSHSVTAHKMWHAWTLSEFHTIWHSCNLTHYPSPYTCVNERCQGSFCTVLMWSLEVEMWFAFRDWWCLVIFFKECHPCCVGKLDRFGHIDLPVCDCNRKLCSVSCSSWTVILDFGFDCHVNAGGLPWLPGSSPLLILHLLGYLCSQFCSCPITVKTAALRSLTLSSWIIASVLEECAAFCCMVVILSDWCQESLSFGWFVTYSVAASVAFHTHTHTYTHIHMHMHTILVI
jgi:hypothetical protein